MSRIGFTYTRFEGHSQAAFALPTILIASFVMLFVLISVLTSVSSSVVTALDANHYNMYTKNAEQSGVAMAKACLSYNNYEPQWSSNPLAPNTNCAGVVQSGWSPYIHNADNVQSTFSVPAPGILANGVQRIEVAVSTNRLRASTQLPWRTYSAESYATTTRIPTFSNIAFGYVGNAGAFFGVIDPVGKVRVAGYNGYGQLGTGNTSNSTGTYMLDLPSGKTAARVFASFLSVGHNMFVLTTDGDVYGVGSNQYGQLGNGNTTNPRTSPVKFNLPAGVKAVYVVPGLDMNYVLGDDHNLYAAGRCDQGMLGTNYTISGCSNRSTPTRVNLPTVNTSDPNTLPVEDTTFVQSTNIATDRRSSYVIMQGGALYAWGANEYGQLGDNTNTDRSSPVRIGTFGNSGQPKAVQVAVDGDAAYILDSNGDVWAMGQDDYGQLGTMTTLRTPNPWMCIDNPGNSTTNGDRIQIYTCNGSTAQEVYFKDDGTIRFKPNSTTEKCFDNAGGSSANGNPILIYTCSSTNPNQQWVLRNDEQIVNPATGKCLDNPGNSRTVGQDLQLYDCNTGDAQNWAMIHVSVPKKVFLPSGHGKVTLITADQWTTLYLFEDGTVWGAGRSELGQLGAATTNEYNPYLKQFILPAGQVATSIYTTAYGGTYTSFYDANSFVVTASGRVYGVGRNNYGQLGTGSTSGSIVSTPVLMSLPSGVKAQTVQSGYNSTVILTTEGKIYTVGNNAQGQLGDGTTTNRSTPEAQPYINTSPLVLY